MAELPDLDYYLSEHRDNHDDDESGDSGDSGDYSEDVDDEPNHDGHDNGLGFDPATQLENNNMAVPLGLININGAEQFEDSNDFDEVPPSAPDSVPDEAEDEVGTDLQPNAQPPVPPAPPAPPNADPDGGADGQQNIMDVPVYGVINVENKQKARLLHDNYCFVCNVTTSHIANANGAIKNADKDAYARLQHITNHINKILKNFWDQHPDGSNIKVMAETTQHQYRTLAKKVLHKPPDWHILSIAYHIAYVDIHNQQQMMLRHAYEETNRLLEALLPHCVIARHQPPQSTSTANFADLVTGENVSKRHKTLTSQLRSLNHEEVNPKVVRLAIDCIKQRTSLVKDMFGNSNAGHLAGKTNGGAKK